MYMYINPRCYFLLSVPDPDTPWNKNAKFLETKGIFLFSFFGGIKVGGMTGLFTLMECSIKIGKV